MSGKLRLNGATSGYSELQAPDVAGDQTFTLPAVGGTLSTSNVVYQQGIWTPAASTGTIETAQGRWWRIGNNVTIQGQTRKFSDRSTNTVKIVGLPYTSIDFNLQAGYTGSVMESDTNGVRTTAYLNTFYEDVSFYASSPSNTEPWSATTYNNLGVSNEFRFQISYLTDDTTFVPINGATIS